MAAIVAVLSGAARAALAAVDVLCLAGGIVVVAGRLVAAAAIGYVILITNALRGRRGDAC